MHNIQNFLCDHGYVISEMVREIHQYHLDDRPSLMSSNVVVDRVKNFESPYKQRRLNDEELVHFYGSSENSMPDYISKEGFMVYPDGKKVEINKHKKI